MKQKTFIQAIALVVTLTMTIALVLVFSGFSTFNAGSSTSSIAYQITPWMHVSTQTQVSSAAQGIYRQPHLFTGSVIPVTTYPAGPGSYTGTINRGTVSIYGADGARYFGKALINSDGTFSVSLTDLLIGTNDYVAIYNDVSNNPNSPYGFYSSTSPVVTITISR